MNSFPSIQIAVIIFMCQSAVNASLYSCPSIKSYKSYSAITVTPTTVKQVSYISALLSDPCGAVLIHPDSIHLGGKNIVALPSSLTSSWTSIFPSTTYSFLTRNLSRLLEGASVQKGSYNFNLSPGNSTIDGVHHHNHADSRHPWSTRLLFPATDTNFYRQYYSFHVLQQKWKDLAAKFAPNVTLNVIGFSHQNRPIYALYIGRTSTSNPRRILINSLQHAREWITVPVATYVVEELAVRLATGKMPHSAFLENVQMIVVPLVNPDGYVITNDTDRFWRKNARPGVRCDGVDLNRNWGFDFGGSHSTSQDSCGDLYIGPSMFSEPETQALQNLVLNSSGIVVHLDVHSYSQLVLGPWAYTTAIPPNLDVIEALGEGIAYDLSNFSGKLYRFGLQSKPPALIYMASGTMSDWTFASNITSFVIELRPERYDFNQFLLPEYQIYPSCLEFFTCLEKLFLFAKPDTVPTAYPTPNPSVSESPNPGGPNDTNSQGIPNFAKYIIGLGVVVVIVAVILVVAFFCRRRPNGTGADR